MSSYTDDVLTLGSIRNFSYFLIEKILSKEKITKMTKK